MNLADLKQEVGIEGFDALAKKAFTKPGYLKQLAINHRKPSVGLARRLVKADPRLTLAELRPDIYGRAA